MFCSVSSMSTIILLIFHRRGNRTRFVFLKYGCWGSVGADYWKSQARKYCDFCKCWISDNKPSVQFHENGKRHKANVEARLREISKKSRADQKAQEQMDKEIRKMEAAAMKAYQKDVQQTLDISARIIRGIPETAPVNMTYVPSVDSGPKWHEAKTENGKIYYWNANSGESRWERPKSGIIIPLPEKDKNKGKKDKAAKRKLEKKFDKSKKKRDDDDDDDNDNDEVKKVPENSEKLEKPKSPVEWGIFGPYPSHNGIGCWQRVENSSNAESEPEPATFEEEIEPQFEFKEKSVTSLADNNDTMEKAATSIQFKKRKVNRGNVRQRSND